MNTRIAARLATLCLLCATPVLAAPREVDLIVFGEHVVTMDAAGSVIHDGAVAVDKGRIVAVGPRAEVKAAYRGRERLDGTGRVLLPGLINGHAHAAMNLLRGVADDLELMTWLTEYIFPAELRFVDPEFVRVGTELACWEMLRGGTTTFLDMYYFSDTIAETVERCGIRALVGASVIDQKSPDAADAAEGLAHAREFVTRWKERSPRVTPVLAPHAVYTLQPEQLKAVRALANELGVGVTIHLAESRFELDAARQRYANTPIHALESLDFFSGPTVGAHVIWPQPDEIPVLARRGVGAIHNPTSNMKIASGIAPVAELLKAGVAVGLGTDGAATNNDLDLWEEMRLAAFLQKVHTMDPTVLPARTALALATSSGAKAIGLGEQIGSLETGKRADLVQVSFEDLHLAPLYDVISHLVYVADSQDVATVVVEGRVVVRDGRVLTLDEAKLKREATAMAAKIRAGLAEKSSP